tara:strand:+ start:180 stop:392 length:213 start_codon:yes stop_codon:yes gene_type:complete
MDLSTLARKELNSQLRQLEEKHNDLNISVDQYRTSRFLTASQQTDLARLKKMKLATKDRILTIRKKVHTS